MEHSKGPWETDGRVGYLDIVCPKGRIAMMDCENDAFWAAELEANAALIVAAPDLLAALEFVLPCLMDVNASHPQALSDDELAQIKRTIAKAKGQP